jgi:hypothetical protein
MQLRSASPNLLRLAALAAVLGGTMLVLANVVALLDLASPDLFGGSDAITDVVLSGRGSLTILGELLATLGLIGLYVRQSEAAGGIGLVGFVLAFLGHELVRGNYLAVLFADLGLALFGIASLRARVYPRAAAVLLIVSALIREMFNPTINVGFGAELPYVGASAAVVLWGVIAWMGFVLLTGRDEGEASTPVPSFPTLLRLGAEAAVFGAALIVLFDIVQVADLFRPDPGSSPDTFGEAIIIALYIQQLLSVLGEAIVMLGLVAFYVRQSEAAPQSVSTQVLGLVGFLVAFVGTFFALDIEDVNWGAALAADLGWALFGMTALQVRLYPRLASTLLVTSALLRGLFNPLIVSFLAGEVGGTSASYLLYQGPGAYLAYASIGVDIFFHAVVIWLGLALLFRTTIPGPGSQQHEDEGGAFRRFSRFRLRLLWVFVLVVGLLPISLVTGIFPGERPPGLDEAQAATTQTNPSCPTPDQATYGAYASSRLVVHNACQHAVGTVHLVNEGETDGDVDILVRIDPEYASLTGSPQNVDNLRRFGYGGDLMMELMPRDGRPTDPTTGEIRSPHIPVPEAGDKVDVWGAWVFDSQHGYYEIHPIFSMSTSSDSGASWGDTYTSGPQYGGPPRSTPDARNAYTRCRDENGNSCIGYYDPKVER